MAFSDQKAQALAARIENLSFETNGWLGAARQGAKARLDAMGLPIKRDEYWRYTNPTALTQTAPTAVATVNSGEAAFFAPIDQLKIVFTDGVFDAAASDDLSLSGVEISRLAEAGAADHWAKDLYSVLETRGQNPIERPLATLNSAYATDGILIHVTAKAAKPIALVYNRTSNASDVILHHCVKLEAGAEATLLESGIAGARVNTVMEVDVADSARFHHIRVQGPEHERTVLTHSFARLGNESLFKSFTMNANGQLTRNESIIELLGDDGHAHVAGAALGDESFLQDDTIFITHSGLRCESRQVFKKVLRNGAHGVFQGKILVKQSAQKTDGYQISQALLLDEKSQFLCKPELEIYADDVKCSHGSTSGAIDETALFYLQSRGIKKETAQSLLVLAFLAEAIQEIEDEAIADDIRERLDAWLNVSA